MIKVDLVKGKLLFLCENGFEVETVERIFSSKFDGMSIALKPEEPAVSKIVESGLIHGTGANNGSEIADESQEIEKEETKREEQKTKKSRISKKDRDRILHLRDELRKLGKVYGPKTTLKKLEDEYAKFSKTEGSTEDDLFQNEESAEDDLFSEAPEVVEEKKHYDPVEVKKALISIMKDDKSGVVKTDVKKYLVDELKTKFDDLDQDGLAKFVVKFGLKV